MVFVIYFLRVNIDHINLAHNNKVYTNILAISKKTLTIYSSLPIERCKSIEFLKKAEREGCKPPAASMLPAVTETASFVH